MSDVDIGLIKQEVLSLLVSAKNGLSEQELLNDYRLFNSNKELPYRDLGYSSLISLLRAWSDVCRIQHQGNNGSIRILAVEEESTKHILSLVKGQRQNKSRRHGRGNRGRGRGGGFSRDDARFSQNTTNFNSNRSKGYTRGSFNGRAAQNVNRSERPTVPSRPSSRGKPNISVQSRPLMQQQPNRSTVSNSMQSRTSSYELRQSTNTNSFDDRRIINNSATLRVTVTNSKNSNRVIDTNENSVEYQNLPSTRSSTYSDHVLNEDEVQYDEDEDREEEVINNIQTLLNEFPHGIRLLALDDLYKRQFGKSLLAELRISNILLLQDFVDDFATISRHGEENGSCDHIITRKDPKQLAQTQSQLLKQITDSGIVPTSFRYAKNLFSYINDSRFQAYVSDIDKTEHCFHIQPIRYQQHIETLMEEIDSYYSDPISNSLLVNKIETGLACVTKYDGAYHRAFIKETDLYRCVIVYVDYGTTIEVDKDEQEFKYLLNHFAQLPAMAIACRLDDLSFIPDDNNLLPETYNELYTLCKDGPFFIEPTGIMNSLITIRILDADDQCLNDIVVQLKLAVKLSAHVNHSAINNSQQGIQNASQPVAIKFDFLNSAAQCPLPPDSEPSTPESNENNSSQPTSTDFSIEHKCKIINVDENKSLYLVRYNETNKPYIPCFNLAQLLNLSESDVLSETLLSRTRIHETIKYSSVFNFLRQTNSKDCLHIHENLIFLFDLKSAEKYIERLYPNNGNVLVDVLRQQANACNEPGYWNNTYESYKPPVSAQSSYENDMKRYNELLNRRRNILCNMLHVTDVNECTLDLTSIENELEHLVQKMRLGAVPQQNSNVSLTPPISTKSKNNDKQQSTVNKHDKLRDLMERCKTLINTILVLDDFIPIDDRITEYIQNNVPFLNLKKNSLSDEQLHRQYSELLHNLTLIVDDLRQQLPASIHF